MIIASQEVKEKLEQYEYVPATEQVLPAECLGLVSRSLFVLIDRIKEHFDGRRWQIPSHQSIRPGSEPNSRWVLRLRLLSKVLDKHKQLRNNKRKSPRQTNYSVSGPVTLQNILKFACMWLLTHNRRARLVSASVKSP